MAEKGHVCAERRGVAAGESPRSERGWDHPPAGSVTNSLTQGTIFP